MTLPKFVTGMVSVVVIVALWSYFDQASIGTALVRAIICAVILQVGYFIAVVAMIYFVPSKQVVSTQKVPNETKTTHEADPGEVGGKTTMN